MSGFNSIYMDGKLKGKNFRFGDNSFDLIRLLAAIIVMLSHSFRHFGIDKPVWSLCFTDGSVGVITFFTLSGYFIFASWETRGDMGFIRWIYNRLLRIYPLYIFIFFVIILLDSLLIGVKFDGTWDFVGIFLRWLCIRIYEPIQGGGINNGVVWTLKNQILFYLLVPLMYGTLKRMKKSSWIILIIGCWLFNFFDAQARMFLLLNGSTFINLAYEFLIGAFIYVYREEILPIISNKSFLAIYGLIWIIWFCIYEYGGVIPYFGIMHNPINGLTLPWLIMGLGYAFGKIRLKIDLSYGIFLWHMIVIEVLLFLELDEWYYMIAAWGITMGVAFITYYIVEKPFLKIKRNSKK